LRNITIACNQNGLTHFGGVYFVHELLRLLQPPRRVVAGMCKEKGGTQHSQSVHYCS